jgi:hypothetical protein
MSSSTGTALTDAAGVANVTLRPVSMFASGAANLRATATVNGAVVSNEVNYSVGATELTLGTLRLAPASIAAYGSSMVSVDVLAGGNLIRRRRST